MELETIFADFNNTDICGRVRLSVTGATQNIKRKNIDMIEGKAVMLDDGDGLKIIGILKFSKEENIWVAEIDRERFINY
jgi:hypothetical protein